MDFLSVLQLEYMQNAIYTSLLASIACGIIGCYVVINRIVFISGGISHTAFGGIGLGYYLGINPIFGAIAFSLVNALTMGMIVSKTRIRSDTLIGILWAVGMAIGILMISLKSGYATDLMSYLFGNILMVKPTDLWLILILDTLILLIVFYFFNDFHFISFDKEYSIIRGLPVNLLFTIIYGLIAFTVVILIKVVGIILVIALLTLPASASNLFTKKLTQMMILSIGFGILFTLGGLFLSHTFDVPSGATIILFGGAIYLLLALVKNIPKLRNKK